MATATAEAPAYTPPPGLYTADEAALLARHMAPEPAALHPDDCPCACGALRGECENRWFITIHAAAPRTSGGVA